MLLNVTNGVEVHPDPEFRGKRLELLGLKNFGYYSLRIAEIAGRENFSLVNLAKPFREYAEKNNVYLHGFENTTLGSGHWNSHGHSLAGGLLAEKICAQIEGLP